MHPAETELPTREKLVLWLATGVRPKCPTVTSCTQAASLQALDTVLDPCLLTGYGKLSKLYQVWETTKHMHVSFDEHQSN